MSQDPTLQPLDYFVAVVVLAVPMLIGIVFAVKDAKKMTRLEYLLGGQRLTCLPVAMSTFVTFQSAISLIGMPNEVYTYGTGIYYFYFGMLSSYVICYFTFIPLMYPLKVTSIYEYLHLRFRSQAVRMLSSVIGCTQTTLYLSVALLSPALALQATVGMPLWVSVLVAGGIGTVYTVLGGIKSVIWTDAFQTVIVFVGICAIIIKGSLAVGGIDKAWSIADEGGRLVFHEFNLDPRVRMSVWGAVLSGLSMWLSMAFNQSTLQRIRSLKTLKDAKLCFVMNIPFVFVYGTALILLGIVTYSYFSHIRCGPYKAGLISNRNQIVPYFVLHAMHDIPGMAGLYIATLFCGALSTLSSGINALAANTVEDILERPLKNVNERTITLITKIATAVFGFLICCMGFSAQYLDGPVTQMANSIFGAFGIPILSMFLVGCMVPWSNKYGALVGGVASLVCNLWLTVGSLVNGRKPPSLPAPETDGCEHSNLTAFSAFNVSYKDIDMNGNKYFLPNRTMQDMPKLNNHDFSVYDISYEWFSVYGLIVGVVVGVAVSYCTRPKKWRETQCNFNYVFPISRRLWSLKAPVKFQKISYSKQSLEINDTGFSEEL